MLPYLPGSMLLISTLLFASSLCLVRPVLPPSLVLSIPSLPSCPAGERRYPATAQDQEEASQTDPIQGAGQQACE